MSSRFACFAVEVSECSRVCEFRLRSGVVVWVSGLQGSRFGAARSFNKKLTEGFGLRVQFRVLGLGFWVLCLGFRVLG